MIKKSLAMSIGLGSVAFSLSAIDSYASQTATVTADALNVRSGPSTTHSVIGKLYKGNTVDILQISNGWCEVKLSNGKTGWASNDFLDTTNTTITEESLGYGIVNATTLNVRSGSSTSNSVIAKIYNKDKVELLASSNGWYKIKLSNGNIGWASGEYITKVNATNTSATTTSTNTETTATESLGYGVVTASALNVRSGASTSNSVISKLYNGDIIEIISLQDGWYKIKLSNGSIGFVSKDYVKLKEVSSNESTTTTKTETTTITSSSNSVQNAVVKLALEQVGKPYVWGAEGPRSFDCSGLTYYIFKNAANITLPRMSKDQSTVGTTVSKSDLQPGDLIFSSTDGTGGVSHVGVYIGDGYMVHSTQSGKDVQKANINSSYWNKTFLFAKRVL
jgi:cell wall-associated NlpC family hydrolase